MQRLVVLVHDNGSAMDMIMEVQLQSAYSMLSVSQYLIRFSAENLSET